MRILPLLVFIVFGLVSHTVQGSDAEALVGILKKAAQSGGGITEREQNAAEKLQEIGPAAIPYLLPLLREKNEGVRDLASYTLRDMKGLTEDHLDALVESRRRGDGWIPPAIARIGTPKAIKFLVDELVRERQTQTQLTWAIKILGKKAVPELLRIYHGKVDWDDRLEQAMFCVFNELGEQAVTAIDPLLKIANDPEAPPEDRVRAIAAIGSIGLPAEGAVHRLQKLQQSGQESLASAATSAILNIGSVEAAPILAAMLDDTADPDGRMILMRDIAALKTRGKSAGSSVAKYLNDDDWNLRVGAARALGYIGYDDAAEGLINLLSVHDDWRLVLSTAESLGRLKVERALPALKVVATAHWYPPVREAAQNAIESIHSGVVAESKYHPQNFAFEFFGYEGVGEKMEMLEIEDVNSIRFALDSTQDQPLTVVIKDEDGTVKRSQLRGVKVEDGYLVGSNRGEWGGEITFVDTSGDSFVIARENTNAIYQTTYGILAVTGLAHMSANSGFIQKVYRGGDGRWIATKWRALPGAPRSSWLLRDGRLLINCFGGIVLVSADGEMTSLSRSESLR